MQRRKKLARAAGAGAVTAMAAAALFMAVGPARADGCVYDSGGSPTCWVDVDGGGGGYDWTGDGGGGGGYGSGGDGGGDDGGTIPTTTIAATTTTIPPTTTTAPRLPSDANRRKGVAAQESAHSRMLRNSCFSTITGMRPTSANRLAFADRAATYTIEGRTGVSGDAYGFTETRDADGNTVVTFYDNFENVSQIMREGIWLIMYSTSYGSPATTEAVARDCYP